MPLPPPPYAALIATGQPNSSPNATTSSTLVIGSSVPGPPRRPRPRPPCASEILSPITSMASGGGPIHVTPRVRHGPGEVGVLGEEPVAGVDRLGAGALDDVEDRVGVEVALGRGLAAEGVRLVGVAHVGGVAVELRVHRDGGDAELAARPHDADGDLAAVGDQDLRERARAPLASWRRVAVSYGPMPDPERRVRHASGDVRVAGRDRLDEPLPPRRGSSGRTGRPRRGRRPPDRRPGPARPHLGRTAGGVAARLGAAAPAARRRAGASS